MVKHPNDFVLRGKNVLLIGADNSQLGVVPLTDALAKAKASSLDLVAVNEKGDQPVCRLMDFGKYLYEEKRKMKDQKRKQHAQKVKEIKFHVNTDTHDYEMKIRHTLDFLDKGHKVRLSLFFRGREMAHRELGIARLEEVLRTLGDRVHVDSTPKLLGRIVSAQVAPGTKKPAGRPAPAAAATSVAKPPAPAAATSAAKPLAPPAAVATAAAKPLAPPAAAATSAAKLPAPPPPSATPV